MWFLFVLCFFLRNLVESSFQEKNGNNLVLHCDGFRCLEGTMKHRGSLNNLNCDQWFLFESWTFSLYTLSTCLSIFLHFYYVFFCHRNLVYKKSWLLRSLHTRNGMHAGRSQSSVVIVLHMKHHDVDVHCLKTSRLGRLILLSDQMPQSGRQNKHRNSLEREGKKYLNCSTCRLCCQI